MKISTDIVIIGGGIAGLWTMDFLKKHGVKVILLESDSLGCGQTIKSQGIIHGGLKYAITGAQSAASNALKDMPGYWQSCLNGDGDIDLRTVKVLSTGQYMWSTNRLTGGITNLFASAAMRSNVDVITSADYPKILKDSAIKGKLYKLDEIVLNIPTLINALATPHLDDCIKIDSAAACSFGLDPAGHIQYLSLTSNDVPLEITAQKYIFTAGAGNEALQQQLGIKNNMQRRPLHMVLVKHPNLAPLYGHCVGLSAAPRLTITTHIAADHLPVWYLGGKLAEDGVKLDSAQQIRIAQQELKELFPELDLRDAKWASFKVDRAEEMKSDGSKPDTCSIVANKNYITAWPTKLALAPVLAAQIIDFLRTQNFLPNQNITKLQLDKYTKPTIATPIWDQLL